MTAAALASVIAAMGGFMLASAFRWARKIAAWPTWARQQPYWPLACFLAYLEAAAGLGFLLFVVQMTR